MNERPRWNPGDPDAIFLGSHHGCDLWNVRRSHHTTFLVISSHGNQASYATIGTTSYPTPAALEAYRRWVGAGNPPTQHPGWNR